MSSTAARASRRTVARARASAGVWAAAAFVASRLVVLLTGWVAVAGHGFRTVEPRYLYLVHGRVAGFVGTHLLDPWANWDGQWYTRIAAEGYRRAFSEAFFPLYPLLLHLVEPLAHSYVLAGILVSWAALGAALWLLYVMVRARFDGKTAAWTVAFLSFFPTSFFLTAVYTESLFLLWSVAAFFFAERRRWLWASLAGMLAVLTRSTGLLLLVPLALLMIEQDRARGLKSALRSLLRRRTLWLALLPAGLLLYAAYLQAESGHAFAFLSAQQHWGRSLASPLATAADATRLAWDGAGRLVHHGARAFALLLPGHGGQRMADRTVIPWLTVLAAAAAIAAGWRRLPAAYTAWSLLLAAFPLVVAARETPLMSYHRFILVAFPLFVAAAAALRRRPVARWIILSVSAALLAWAAASFALFWFVA